MKFFKEPPKLLWSKILCPVCQEPTGKKSQCYKLADENTQQQKKLLKIGKSVLPIFSYNCGYRQDNFWQATSNYPISHIMISQFHDIPGVEKLQAIKKYTFQVSFAELFNENDVKQKVTAAHNAYIKYLQVLESSLEDNSNAKISGLILPNGVIFNVDTPQDEIIAQELNNTISGTKLLE